MIYSKNNLVSKDEICRFISAVWQPGCVYELRCPKAGKFKVISGYFNEPAKFVQAAAELSGQVPGLYFTLNPVNPALIARANNTAKNYAEHTTNDNDITQRYLLLIDADPTRPAGISSNEEEHNLAIAKAEQIREWLTEEYGFPEPIFADSGNGAHLLYSIALTNDGGTNALIREFLGCLKRRWDDDRVAIDEKVFNASRISKVYGTLTKKGDSTEDRPHRLSHVLRIPEKFIQVSRELILTVVEAGEKASGNASADTAQKADDGDGDEVEASIKFMEKVIENAALVVQAEKPDNGTYARRWILEECPFCKSEDKSAVLTVSRSGALGFGCQHKRCKEKTWQDFKRKFAVKCEKKSALALLIETGRSCELWHSADMKSYMTTPEGNTYQVPSGSSGSWLLQEFHKRTGDGVSETTLKTAMATLSANALFEGKEHKTYCRVARLDDRIIIDLARPDKQCVIVDKAGWRVERQSEVRFTQRPNAAPMPIPVKGGAIDLLRPFVNVRHERFPLFVGALLDYFKGHGAYHVVLLASEHGSAKTTMLKIARSCLDPVHKAKLSGKPKDSRSLYVEATQNPAVFLDNLSHITPEIADTLCIISTGGGARDRKLYSDGDEHIFDCCCPVWLNSIEQVIERQDLASRAITISPENIKDENRKDEKVFYADFDKSYPLIMGAIFDAVSSGLARLDNQRFTDLPRMADSAKWISACFPAFGWTYDDWQRPFNESNEEMVEAAIGNSMPATSLLQWIARDKITAWTGTAQQLYDKLREYVEDAKSRYFPGTPQHLMNALRRVAPVLRTHYGVQFFRHEHEDGRPKKERCDGIAVINFSVLVQSVADGVADCCSPLQTSPSSVCNAPVAEIPIEHGNPKPFVAPVAPVADKKPTFTIEEKRGFNTTRFEECGFLSATGATGATAAKDCEITAENSKASVESVADKETPSATPSATDCNRLRMGGGWWVENSGMRNQWRIFNEDGRCYPETGSQFLAIQEARRLCSEDYKQWRNKRFGAEGRYDKSLRL